MQLIQKWMETLEASRLMMRSGRIRSGFKAPGKGEQHHTQLFVSRSLSFKADATNEEHHVE